MINSRNLSICFAVYTAFSFYNPNYTLCEAYIPVSQRPDPSPLVIRYKQKNTFYALAPYHVKTRCKNRIELSSSFFEEDQEHSNDNIIAKFDPLDIENNNEQNDTQQLSLWAARALLLSVAVLWGTNFASVKYLENLCFHPPCVHPPSEAALARFGVAALASMPFLINQRKDIILAGFECGLWITLGYFTQALALSTVSSGQCAFICSLTVVVVPLLSALLYGKPMKPINIVSGALAVAGVGVLEGMVDFHTLLNIQPAVAEVTADVATSVSASNVLNGMESTEMISSAATAGPAAAAAAAKSSGIFATIEHAIGISKGDLLALGQPLGFGLAFMRIEHYVEKFKNVDNRIMTLSAAQCVSVGLLSFFWVLFDFHGTIPNMEYMIEPHRLGAIAWTGIMTTVVAIYLEGFALQVVSATEAALTFASEPVWASLFGAWLLHENLNVNSYVGGAIILGACLLSAVDGGDNDEVDAEGNGSNEIIATR
mmetsp:Transcript_25297/g.31174  ORF Transcript_25297/g.31174 Transcript_25297/m.31174 type:complete len:485 (-) Transcript_25297:116-1570(-)